MIQSKQLEAKLEKARLILERCIGTNGVWADSTRYRHQCWTRDFVLAIMPALFDSERAGVVRQHLESLSHRQRDNGQIPILFLDRTWPFLREKIKKSLRDGKMSFMLKRFFARELWNLTPGTRDSEILYLIGVHEYTRRTKDRDMIDQHATQIKRAMQFIEENLLFDDLIIGCDWRDTMEKELGNRPLLSNNSLLVHAYDLLGEKDKAARLRAAIDKRFWQDGHYHDYPGNPRFDPLGGALAVLYDVAPPEHYESLIKSFRSVDTPHGVTIKCRHNPFTAEEKTVIERTDGVVVWPFIVGFTVLALLKMRQRAFAEEQFNKLLNLDGFREWYDPDTGNGYGAIEQLWSATLFLRAATALGITE